MELKQRKFNINKCLIKTSAIMKMKNILAATILSAFALASCSDDDPNVYSGSSAINFDASIGEMSEVKIRMSGKTWDANDAIGIYMKKAGQGLSGNIVNSAENVKHTTPGTNKFTPANLAQGLQYPEDGSAVDFIAYYPYTASISGYVYKVDVSTQTSQPAIDLIYSNNAVNQNNTSPVNVGLQFTHQLSKLVINVKAGNGVGSLNGLVTTVTGLNTKADFALADGTLSSLSDVADIRLNTGANGADMISEGIIIPSSGAGRTFVFTVGSQVFKWDIPSTVVFEKGKRYTYDAVLSVDGVVMLEPEGTITDWEDAPGQTIVPELQQDGDGTQANPYTISQVAAKVGETGKWVTGYIVGSTTRTRAVGTPSTENILLAATADETNEANCIPIDIASSAVKEYLDIVASPDLIGVKVKVQGDIVNNIFGGALAMTNIIAQEGGKKGGGSGGEEVEFFHETFGNTATATERFQIANYTGWSMKNVTYSNPYSTWADIRTTNTFLPTYNLHVWFPATTATDDKTSALLIEGIEGGYTGMKLSYDLATNKTNTNANIIVVKCNDVVVTVPSMVFEKYNEFKTITLDIPDNTTKIEFYSGSNNEAGYRLDNIKIKGTK